MKKILIPVFLVIAIAGFAFLFFSSKKQSVENVSDIEISDEMNSDAAVNQLALQIPLEETVELRREFNLIYKNLITRRQWGMLREFYEIWIDKIGANGIIAGFEEITPLCHDEGHDFGKVVYAKTGDIGVALTTCQDSCYSGCMHGVLMEAFSLDDDHADLEMVAAQVEELCERDRSLTEMYLTGDCYHGVGHAFMYLAAYDPELAIPYCDALGSHAARYYCATGAYMEYVNARSDQDVKDGKDIFYPCDTAPFPAACFRYRMSRVAGDFYRNGGNYSSLVEQCTVLENDNTRTGCFHGLGNAHMGAIVHNQMTLGQVCMHAGQNEQLACVDGAMERIEKYHREIADGVCRSVRGGLRKRCFEVLERKIYNMERDFSLYQR
jgi:hypothetical protein